MKKTIKNLAIASLFIIVNPLNAAGLYGTGDNFGSGWQSDGNGGLRGTGDNFGRGYRR